MLYALFGQDRTTSSPGGRRGSRSFFAAAEPSYDFNWMRMRGSALFASGDGNLFDNVQRGFDAIFENPIFAGADTSYWIRQTILFAGGGRAVCSTTATASWSTCARRRSRASPTSSIRARSCSAPAPISTSRPSSACPPTSTTSGSTRPRCLSAASQGTIRNDIGWDVSAAAIWRPSSSRTSCSSSPGPCSSRAPASGPATNEPRDKRYYSVLSTRS